ncbi:MAG: response regulator transcription factor [Chloroflexi bacterium]|nr:response regulator transcription factor [Chloroflexota bacterium]
MSPNSETTPSRILIAEDAVDLRDALTETLLELDYTVQAARDGYEAVTMFPEFKPDLAILDMHMPLMNGSDVCAVIRQTSDIPIIMFTSADDVELVNGAILKGATDFVLKTTGIEELAARVQSHLLKQREPLKPAITSSSVFGGPASDEQPKNLHVSDSAPNAIKTFTVIIDPDKESRSKIASILARLNQDFIEVESAGEGIAAIKDYDPDIIVTEWSLPDMDTFKMFSSLRRGLKEKKLIRIITSDKLSPETQRKSNFVGINNFLEKPIDAGKVEVLVGDCVKKALRNLKRSASMAV